MLGFKGRGSIEHRRLQAFTSINNIKELSVFLKRDFAEKNQLLVDMFLSSFLPDSADSNNITHLDRNACC